MASTAPELIHDPIPTSVNQEDLLAALQPLCELLKVTPNHFFEIPGLQIGFGRITFVVISPSTEDEWVKSRPQARPAELDLQGLSVGELSQVVSVQITRRDPLSGDEVAI